MLLVRNRQKHFFLTNLFIGSYYMTTSISQGAKANYSGKQLEAEVEAILRALDLDYQREVRFTDCYGNSRSRMDFMVDDLAIECKRQNVSGTADQKIPFVYENLSMFKKGLLVLDGEHFRRREGIITYLNAKRSSFFDWCFVEELKSWLEANV